MSKNENEKSADKYSSIRATCGSRSRMIRSAFPDQLKAGGYSPPGVDRRAFLMRSAVVGAAAVMTGRSVGSPSVAAQVKPLPPGAEPKGVAGGPR